MTFTLSNAKLKGAVTPPPSKSQAHRLLIAAALAEGDSLIKGIEHSEDIDATLRCLAELGAGFEETAGGMVVHGMAAGPMSPMRRMALPHLDCGESGSTLRFLIPVALAVRGGGVFTGKGRLMERPLKPYFDIFEEKGIFYELKDGVLTIRGELKPGAYRLPGDVSSQFFTGLLYALPLLDGPSAIFPTTREIESESYIIMTLRAMDRFGVPAMATMSLPPQYHVMGKQTYRPAQVEVEGDWSNAAFWYAANALGGEVEIRSMDREVLQGDRVILDHFASLSQAGDRTIDVSDCPDLVPALAAMAAVRSGITRIINAGRLRIKESDRLATVCGELCKLGAEIEEGPGSLTIVGREGLTGGVEADAHNDHRIAMMLAIAATVCKEPVTLCGVESVRKSYPGFWKDYVNLGGAITQVTEPESELKLVIPTAEYLDQVADYRREFIEAGSSMDGCGPLRKAESPTQWMVEVERYTRPETLPEGKVQATQFLTVRKSDNKLVGMIQVRHYFNEYLEKYGGHIGYSIRPRERRKGYAAEQLRLTLPWCKSVVGMDRVLISCLMNNVGSRKTMLKNGGVYESTVHEPYADEYLERYWFQLT